LNRQWKALGTLTLCFAMLLQFVLPMAAFAGEDNGFRGQAKLIEANTQMEGTVNSKTGEDWYYFTAPATTGPVEVMLAKKSAGWNSVYVYLYDKDNFTNSYLTYGSAYNGAASVTDFSSYIKAGKSYYLKVDGEALEDYSLYLSAHPYAGDNGFRGAAQVLPYNSEVSGAISDKTGNAWYQFTAPSTKGAVVELLGTSTGGINYTYFYLYDADNFTNSYLAYGYVSSWNPTTSVDFSNYIKPGKKYYVKANGTGGDTFTLFLSGPAAEEKVVTKVSVTPSSTSLLVGKSTTLKATATYSDNTTEDVTASAAWRSSDDAVASVSAGKVTANAEGDAMITASYKNQSGTATVTVGSVVEAELKALTATPKVVSLQEGEEVQVKLTGIYSDGKKKDVTTQAEWEIDDEEVAVVANGMITGLSEGTATVTAMLEDKEVTIKVTVKGEDSGEPVITEITASEESIQLAPKKSIKLKVYAIYSDGDQKDITVDAKTKYRSTKTSVATVAKGLVKAGSKPGTATIVITYEGFKLEVPVEVTTQQVKSLKASTQAVTVAVDERKQVELTAVFTDGKSKDVTTLAKWTTDDSEVADVEGGEIVGIAPGVATITASYGGKEIEIAVEVTDEQGEKELEGIQASETNVKMVKGTEKEVNITAVYTDGTTEDITESEDLKWTVRQASIASVVEGVISANAVGKTTVTASYQGFEVKINVEVVAQLKIKKLVADPKNVALTVGETQDVTITAFYEDGSEADVTQQAIWTAKLTKIAKIAQKGTIQAVGVGKTTVTVKVGTSTVTINVSVTN